MAKEAFYFSHDYGARNDPKLQKVLMKLGQEGKGVYWDLVEMLFEEGGKLLLSECDGYAFALRTNESCIAKLINDFGLFCKDATYFWSDSVNRRIYERDAKSEKARQSALNRWNNANALKTNANALRQVCEGNAIKERKGKEKKVNKIFIAPSVDEVILYFSENGYDSHIGEKAFNYYDVAGWNDSKGDPVKNWKQKMQSVWFKDDNKIKSTLRQIVY
jgi:hypothetical protein